MRVETLGEPRDFVLDLSPGPSMGTARDVWKMLGGENFINETANANDCICLV